MPWLRILFDSYILIMTIEKGRVYYNRNLNRLISPREQQSDGVWLCGGYVEFYNDALTNNHQQPISEDAFAADMELVTSLDKHDALEFDPVVNAYRVREIKVVA